MHHIMLVCVYVFSQIASLFLTFMMAIVNFNFDQ